MSLKTLALNDTPLEDLGLVALSPLDGWLDIPERTLQTVPLLGRQGQVVAGNVAYLPRHLLLGWLGDGGTMALSRALAGTTYQALDGLLEVTFIDAPGRMIYAEYVKARGSVYSVQLLGTDYQVAGELVAANPFWYDLSPASVALPAGVATAPPYGTAGGNWTCWIAGPATNPSLTLTDAAGNTLAQMRFTLTLGANDVLRLETRDRFKIKKLVAGVESDAYSTLNAADTFFALDPNDNGLITLSAGTGLLASWRGWTT